MSETKLSQAKARLMLEQPYFATMAGALSVESHPGIATVSYQGDRMLYNPEYLEALSIEESMSVLAHAVMRQALFHDDRGTQKQSRIWQIASAYAINDLLMQNGFVLPPMATYSNRFERLCTEEIYALLLGEESKDLQEEPDRESPSAIGPVQRMSDEEYRMMATQVLSKLSRQEGALPEGLERFVDTVQPSQVGWREQLYRYVTAHTRSDYRLFPPNKKHLYRGVALPSVSGEMLQVAVAIDTSASVDDTLLRLFLAELSEIMQLFPDFMIELIECDATIRHIQRLYPTEPLAPCLHGGGGTDFRPVFSYLAAERAAWRFLIYFTDGQGRFPVSIPEIETLWVMPDAVEVPFGERIVIEKT